MPKLLDRMPFPNSRAVVQAPVGLIRLRPDQLIVWVSLTHSRVDVPNPRAVPFPVILDTGFSHSLAIRERHLIDWGGLRPDMLMSRAATRDRGTRVSLHVANVWAHPNRRGTREPDDKCPPHLVRAFEGISVYPGDFPRLPLLGLRAIAENDLLLTIDGRRREATLRTSAGWWPF